MLYICYISVKLYISYQYKVKGKWLKRTSKMRLHLSSHLLQLLLVQLQVDDGIPPRFFQNAPPALKQMKIETKSSLLQICL